MSLLEIRQKFIESSGRYDLVTDTTTWADAGANWFIQAGQRYLDRMLYGVNARAKYFGTLLSGHDVLKIRQARVIEEVYLISSLGKFKLRESTPNDLQDEYREITETQTPLYYAPLSVRIAAGSDLNGIRGDLAHVIYPDIDYSGLYFGAKADQDYGIEIGGLFYSPTLTADADVSYWTELQPEILVAAAFMTMERFYRNFEGAKESRASVEDLVQQLDFDAVAQEIVNITVLGG